VSPIAKDLICNILQVDPTKRFTIEKILSHPWCNLVKEKLDKGVLFKDDNVNIDGDIVKEIYYNIDKFRGNKDTPNMEDIVTSIEENQHSCITATY
jgi:serine/threonine protein kinase